MLTHILMSYKLFMLFEMHQYDNFFISLTYFLLCIHASRVLLGHLIIVKLTLTHLNSQSQKLIMLLYLL